MNLRLVLIVAASFCAFLAMVAGFDWGWFGIEGHGESGDYPGLLALSLLCFFTSHLTGGK